MSQQDERMNELVEQTRATYNVPPDVPREEMWKAISAGIDEIRAGRATEPVVDIAEARRRRALATHPAWWAVAAAALVVLGIGIGRTTAPVAESTAAPEVAGTTETSVPGTDRVHALELAAREHLGRSESLLTMVRADARNGSLEPGTAQWAQGLLSQTRLLIDARRGGDPAVEALLEDLELVLIQIVGASRAGSQEAAARARTELELTLRSLEQREVLPRIHAVLPTMEGE